MSETVVKQEIKDANGNVIATKITTAEAVKAEQAAAAEAPSISVQEVKKPAETKKKPRVGITETACRDAHQSIMATRLRTEDMLPICEAVDEVGYHSIECWGGATFDSALRFLNEDP